MRHLHKRGWLLGAWALAVAVWGVVPVFAFADSWQERGIGVVLAVAFGGVLAFVVRSGFRRAAARPPGYRSIDRWLAPLPAWLSAPLIACLYVAAPAVIVLGMAWHFHRLPLMSLWGLGLFFIGGCGVGGTWSLAWQEQRKSQGPTEVARG
jgi:hypothetical protein